MAYDRRKKMRGVFNTYNDPVESIKEKIGTLQTVPPVGDKEVPEDTVGYERPEMRRKRGKKIDSQEIS